MTRTVLLAGLLFGLLLVAAGVWAQDADDAPAAGKPADTSPQAPAATQPVEAQEHEHEHAAAAGFAWWRLVKPMGIVTLGLLVATVTLGLLTHRYRRGLFKWHRLAASVAIASAMTHAAIVIFT